MNRWLSATYRADLAMLAGRIPAEAHETLMRMAEAIQEARELAATSDAHLDGLVAAYAAHRHHLLEAHARPARTETLPVRAVRDDGGAPRA